MFGLSPVWENVCGNGIKCQTIPHMHSYEYKKVEINSNCENKVKSSQVNVHGENDGDDIWYFLAEKKCSRNTVSGRNATKKGVQLQGTKRNHASQPASQRCSVLVAFHIRHGRDDRVLNSQMAQPEWELNSTCIWTVSMGSWISRVKLNPIQCSYSLLTPWVLPSIQAFRLVCLFVVVLLLHSSIVSSWNF